jgi:hypothetical protein
MLTDSCCPIISPTRFRHLFYKNGDQSIFSWKRAWWNPTFHRRANLVKLPKELWLANDPWFILTRENVNQIFHFVSNESSISKTICSGGLANESLFAIIFKYYGQLEYVKCAVSHLTDWNRMTSATSPHVFKEANKEDITFIDKELERNCYAVFIRKVSTEFPDEVLRNYILDDELSYKDRDRLMVVKYFCFLLLIMVIYMLL